MNSKQIFFDRLAGDWDEIHSISEEKKEALNRLVGRFGVKAGDRVLDIGCGTGRITKLILPLLSQRGSITGCDFALNMLRNAVFTGNGDFRLVCCDAHFLPFKDSYFDKAVLFSCFPHFDNKELIIAEVKRVLKSKGRLFICHLSGSEKISCIHKKAGISVENDTLPDKPDMINLLTKSSVDILDFVDEDNLYFVSGRTK